MTGILDFAGDYIRRGWAVVPVPYKSKRPAIDDWPNLRITEGTAPRFFNGEDQNIGVRLGGRSGGLTDADLDCQEAIIAAGYLMPKTGAIFGRVSKRFSHRLYKTTLAETQDRATVQFKDTQKPPQVILEIRIGAEGEHAAQTIFPGSMHPSGELITWEENGEPSVADGTELLAAGARAAACVLLARSYPQQGGRHEGAIIVAGFLARCGFSLPDTKLFLEALTAVTMQPPDKKRDMLRAAGDTAEAFAAGRNTFGLPKMKEVFGEPVTKKCAEWLGYRAEARGANGERAAEARAAGGFVRGDAGQILKGHPENIRHAIGLLGVKLRHNEFSNQTEVADLPGRRGPEFHDPDAHRLRFLIQETYGFLPSYQLFEHVLIDIAHQNRFHPVREWLALIEWDGVPRIDNWLRDYGGADDTAFNRAVGRIFLIAAVRRVRRPGVKFDTMIVFESPTQGKNKSQAARLLATRDEWFNDNLPLGARPQEVIEQISGSWIVEFPELAGIATREVEHIKAFLSRQVDKARPAYGRRREDVKRQFVACATTNDEEYLKKDERRFLPVRIEKFDLAALGRDVPQLWAEAAKYEADGEPITLQEDLWGAAAEVRAARTFENPYQARLSAELADSVLVTAERVWQFLGIPSDQRGKAGKDVGQAMREIGFARKQAGRDQETRGIKLKRGDWFYERKG